MSTREAILEILGRKDSATGRELREPLGITRQALNLHLKRLIEEGKVFREGRSRGAVYRVATRRRQGIAPLPFRRKYRIAGLQEDRVFREVGLFLNLDRALSPGARDIGRYAFTEMLNNAIDHSRSGIASVEASLSPYAFRFRIRDFGAGLFHTIRKKFSLSDEPAAVGELLKGKTTTMEERHSGEGIFFTSKAADILLLRSHRIELVFDNKKPDLVVAEKRFLRGTEVDFEIGRRSRRKLSDVFARFAPEEFEYRFERTRVHVRIYQEACVSRSEARRMLHGLDRFREVILDFEGVRSLGQGFADEVFRVFRSAHPETSTRIENLAPALRPVIQHVLDDRA